MCRAQQRGAVRIITTPLLRTAQPDRGSQLTHPRIDLAGDIERPLETRFCALAVRIGKGEKLFALARVELRQESPPRADDLDRFVDRAEPLGRLSGPEQRSRVDV